MPRDARRKSPYQRAYLLRLSQPQWDELTLLKEQGKRSEGGNKSAISKIIRSFVDDGLAKLTRRAQGGGTIELPPVPYQKMQLLVKQGAWTGVDAIAQHAIAEYLDRVANSPEIEKLDQRLMRDKTYAAETAAREAERKSKRSKSS